MRRRISGGFVLLFVSVMVLLACAPQATPAPTVAPTPSQPASIARAAPASISPEDEAWTKVVEAAKKEGRLTVYSVHLVGDIAIAVTQAFTKKTGLRLEIVAGPSNTALERVKVERRIGSQIGSVMTGNSAMFLQAKLDGLTQSVGDLPELRTKDIRYDPRSDKEGHVLGLIEVTNSPWINTNLVRPGTEPRSWRDLLKPEWRGRINIAAGDPSASVFYYMFTRQGRLDDAYFQELGKQELQYEPSNRIGMGDLSRGQSFLAFISSATVATPFLVEGAPIKAIDMAEGIARQRSGALVLVQGSPHLNAARVFINWLVSQEGQNIFLKPLGGVGFRKDVPSFVPPQALLDPANPISVGLEDELEIGRIQREGIVDKLLRGRDR